VLQVGDDFAGYVIDAILGRGGHAAVYRAHRPAELNRVVALKILDDKRRGNIQIARLRREFEFAHQLDHPHVVTVYDNGVGWLTMEVIGGGTSSALPDRQTRLTALAQIADALDYTHRCGIVHCDVKPTNILVSPDFSRAVLIDFGVAYALSETVNWHATRVEASLPYAAPELLRGRPPSALTDQYALACTAVELLLGRPPFSGETWMELVDAHLTQPAPSYSNSIDWVPRSFDSALHRALAKMPDSRFDSCTEMIENLSDALAGD
jgi:serine/threonine protein kinase